MAIQVAIIGAGSLTFARGLTRDILGVGELGDSRIALMDIHETNMRCTYDLLEREISAAGLGDVRLSMHTDRRSAVADADYVINTTRIGGLDAFALDVEIPLDFGIDQCVGDTLCAGGIMYGQRNIPFILDLCRDMRELARPGAMLLNYANPNAMNTWAANHFGQVECVGLCHGVQAGHHLLRNLIQFIEDGYQLVDRPESAKIPIEDVDILCAGINHQTWYVKVQYRHEDYTGRLLEALARHPEYSRTEKVRIDILKRFGYFSTESNGHLSEYLPWYRKRDKTETAQWIDESNWIHGRTGGYLETCRHWRADKFEQLMADAPEPIGPGHRSHEHGSWIIEARETGRIYRGHFNVVNRGVITNLPDDCIIEAPGFVDRLGIRMPVVGDLPTGCAAICNQSVQVQRLAVQAAVSGDPDLLLQAMLLDPLTGAVCTPPEIERLRDRMLKAQARWLPQYAEVIDGL